MKMKFPAMIALLTIAVGLIFLGQFNSVYTPGYIATVFTRFDANSDDYLWMKSVRLSKSVNPAPLRKALSEETVHQAMNATDLFRDLDQFLEQSSTTSLLAVRDGQLIYEKYFNGSDSESLQSSFSVSKSVLSILIGRALNEGILNDINDSITTFLPELEQRDPSFARITLAHLIDMQSGIEYSTNISFPVITNDNPLIYYSADRRALILEHTQVVDSPGQFLYNDYNPNMNALALERAATVDPLQLMKTWLIDPLGFEDDSLWTTDNHGFGDWASGFVATSRDLAKIGLLMLESSSNANQNLISADWYTRSTTYPNPPSLNEYNGRQWAYRNGWWQVLRPQPPNDFAAIGRFGQMIYVSPRNNIVFVRTGRDDNPPSDYQLTQLFFMTADNLGSDRR